MSYSKHRCLDGSGGDERARVYLKLIEARVLLRVYASKDVCRCVSVPGVDLKCHRCAAMAIIDGEI